MFAAIADFAAALALIAWGLALYLGRGNHLIAGFARLAPHQQARYDQKALGRFAGKVVFSVAGALVLMGVAMLLGQKWLLGIATALVIALPSGALWWSGLGRRYLTSPAPAQDSGDPDATEI